MLNRSARAFVLAVAVAAGIGLGYVRTAEAAPSMTLSPDSGPAPSQEGTISGSGWECSPGVVYVGPVSVSGRGVTGSASVGRTGVLSGAFTVDGEAGDSVTITVRADESCPTIGPPIYLSATDTFHFDEPTPEPTATRTPTPLPATATKTPTPAPTVTTAPPRPSATVPPRATATPPAATATAPSTAGSATAPALATPTPGPAAPGGAETMVFDGCIPAGPVQLEFVPLFLVTSDPPADAQPTGPAIMVPAVQSGDGSASFAFVPPASEPGRVFRVTPKSGDARCKPGATAPGTYWVGGQDLVLPMDFPGSTQLYACAYGDKSPCELPVVKGAMVERGAPPSVADEAAALPPDGGWVTEKGYFAGDLGKGKFRFRSIVENADAKAAVLQASILPIAKNAGDDPPGLLATWDVDCVNCEFTVDLSALAPPPPPKKKSWAKKTWDAVKKPFTATGDAVWGAITWTGELVGIGGGDGGDKVVQAEKVMPATAPSGEYYASTTPVFALPTTFYFRLRPLAAPKGDGAGPPSNIVTFNQVEKPDIKIVSSPTPVVTESPYDVTIVSYHGILPPQVPNKICYIATADAWPADIWGFTYTTDPSKAVGSGAPPVKKGQAICKPEPQEPSLIEAIISWAEDAVNWASGVWSDLKEFAVDVILKYTPLGLQCSLVESAGAIPKGACETAFAIALDATLVALGIPPDLPNFDQLVDQGVQYLAAEIASQVGIPPKVVEAAVQEGGPYAGMALNIAEEKMREELQKQIAANLTDAATNIGLGYAAAVGWVPDGIPVRPDDYQPPAMTVQVTRKPGVPGGDAGCTLYVSDYLTLTKEQVDNPDPGWAASIKSLPHPLSSLTQYDLFGNQDPPYDKSLFVPPLEPGQSYTIPMTFAPNYYNSGWHPLGLISTTDYIFVWRYLHDFGKLHLSATGCGSDSLETPAKAILIGASVTP